MFNTQNLYQNDEKWKKKSLGNSNETIGGWGCLLTSVTMMLNGMGYNETPETVNEKMKAKGGFQGAFFIPSVIPYAFPSVQYKSMQPCESFPAPVAQIDAAVAAGKPVILQVDWNKQAGIQTHFVLVKEKKGDDYVLYDPYKYGGDGSDKEVLLTKRYKYNGATLETEISAVLWFDGNIPPSPPKPPKKISPPADSMTLYVIEDDLALRADPSIGGYLWKRMTAGSELKSLEDAATTKAKLGQQGQWVHIQDSTGQQGYTAAWYVSEDKNAQPAPPAAPQPAPATTTPAAPATTTAASAAKVPVPPGAMELLPTEEVAFRTQPVIADNTLIRRVPPTEKFICLEPADQVINKVGVTSQWLNVQDQTGKQGYVAAWYVKYASGTTAQAQAAAAPPADPNAPVKVRTTIELVALRRKPVVDPSTLIEYLPIGTELSIIEPGGEQKIGANNQWLHVRGIYGTEGYIAAWFVAR